MRGLSDLYKTTDRHREYMKAYRKRKRESINAYQRAYYKANSERFKTYRERYKTPAENREQES